MVGTDLDGIVPAPERTPRPRVMLVTRFDDERAIYEMALRRRGWEVLKAGNPAEAFALALTTRPNVIVARVGRGVESNGVDLVRQLRADERLARVPVIVVSSMSQPVYRSQAREAGCDAYLLLPILPDTLIAEIERVLARTHKKTA